MEENKDITKINEINYDNLLKESKLGSVMTSVRISVDFFNLCKDNKIKFSEAMRVGIGILLAERGIRQYDNHLNVYRKMTRYQQLAEEAGQKADELNEKLIAIEEGESKNTTKKEETK